MTSPTLTIPATTLSQWHLDIPEAIAQSAWQQSQTCPTPRAQWNTYLNRVCLETLLPLLTTDYAPTATSYPEAIGTVWELVSGTGILGGAKRLVLIPDKSLDRNLSVPQEWVESSEWAGDYYLAIQVNPDEQWLAVWGYATHAMVKTHGNYDADDRTYSLEADELIQDLNALWVVQQVNPQEITQAEIPAIRTIDPTQAENLLTRLATADRPRLEIPFGLWMGCLQEPHWRQRLSALRRGETASQLNFTNLSQWLQNTFESGWQTLESLLGETAETAFSFRKAATVDTPAVRRVKALRLPTRLLLLLMAVDAEPDGRMGIRVQVRSGDETVILPSGLILSLQSASGEVIQRVQAGGDNLAVQLQYFRCPTGTEFQIKVRIDERSIEERFMA